jgi:hypothetical protein
MQRLTKVTLRKIINFSSNEVDFVKSWSEKMEFFQLDSFSYCAMH